MNFTFSMKKLIPILLVLILFSSAFSSKIDPYLIKQFSNSNIQTFSQHNVKFLVWYKGNIPSGDIIKKYPFNVVEMKGNLDDIEKVANNSNVLYIFGNRPFKILLNETINQTDSSIGDIPKIFSKYNGSGIKLEVIDQGANWSLFSKKASSILSNNIGEHGTFVISEIISNSSSFPGIARGVDLYDGNVFNSEFATLDQILDGINWGLMNNVSIESMSFGSDAVGFGSRDSSLQLLYNFIFSQSPNTLFVVAAGNNGTNGSFTIAQPGSSASPNVITVGAIDKKENIEDFSSKGPLENNRIKPDICATGDLYSFNYTGKIIELRGTSMATPLVAGAAALIEQAANKTLDPVEVKLILMEGSNNNDNVFSCGAGILNVSKSISLLNSSIIYTNDNYLGYVGNNTNLNMSIINLGNSNQTINVSVYYYNKTLWKNETINLRSHETKFLTFNLTIPDLPWNESYGYIILNNSAHLPFSWAKAVFISPYNFNKVITVTNRFYTLNYSQLPKDIPMPLFLIISNNSYPNEIMSFDKDFSGFEFNNITGNFIVFPYPPQQIWNGKFYNLINESGNLSLWKFDFTKEVTNYSFSGKGVLMMYGDKPLILVNGKECQSINNVFCNDFSVISYNDSVNITVYNPTPFEISFYSFIKNQEFNGINSTNVSSADLYSFENNIIPIFGYINPKLIVPNQILIHPSSYATITINLSGNYPNSTLVPFYIWFNTEGLFGKDQIVILKKNVTFSNGKTSLDFNLFVSKNMRVYYCLGELETTNGDITCNGISNNTYIGFNPNAKVKNVSIDSSWLSDLIETVSKMLYLYVK